MPTQMPLRRISTALILCFAMLLAPMARAQSLIRDAEIEFALRQLAAPLAAQAGLNMSSLRIMVINDSSMNAFVADTRTVFLHSGLILKMDNAEMLQAVIAHEMAHIANGHLTRRMANYRGAGRAAALGLALSLAAAATGSTQAAIGLAAGSSSSAQRVFFGHTRAEESSADQAGARYMARAGIDTHAMVDVLEIFRGQEALNVGRRDPYVVTHPLPAERLRAAKGLAAAYGDRTKPPNQTAKYWFARAKGKLGAFIQNPSFTLRKVGKKDQSDVAVMRRAVAYHRKPDTKKALAQMDKLIAMRPQDAFVHELRGQILLESRNFAAAVNAYNRAVNLAPSEPLILAGYGRALLAVNTSDNNRRALSALNKAYARDPYDPRMLRDLAVAHARAGNNGMASLATAERYAVLGKLGTAATHAQRAMGLLPRGSSGWRRAEDIVVAAKRVARKK